MEMVSSIVYQLTKNLSMEEIERSGFDKYYVDHTLALWPQAAGGTPFNSCVFQSKGDPITDLFEDMAAEQKARSTYDNILRLVHDSDVCEPIRFLRAREIVHFQRFGEAKVTDLSRIEAKASVILTDTFAFLISIVERLFLQHIQIHIQSCIDVSCKQIFHCRKIMFYIILIKCIIVGNSICKLNINRWVSCLH